MGGAGLAGGVSVLTLRMVKHELRTPINHIVGYSEMLIEDLAGGPDAAGLSTMQAILAAGKDLLAGINAQISGSSDPDSVVSSEVLASLRSVVGRGVDRVLMENLGASDLARSQTFSADVMKILDAAARLATFAGTGEIAQS
jgi:hypothetical protein